jgi:hypothetical protein
MNQWLLSWFFRGPGNGRGVRQLLTWCLRRSGNFRGARLKSAYCSFCRRSHTEVGPLAEGPDLVFICRRCASLCGELIAQELARRGSAGDPGGSPEL